MLQHDDEGAEGEDKWRLGGGGKHALRQVEDRSAGQYTNDHHLTYTNHHLPACSGAVVMDEWNGKGNPNEAHLTYFAR